MTSMKALDFNWYEPAKTTLTNLFVIIKKSITLKNKGLRTYVLGHNTGHNAKRNEPKYSFIR